MNINHNLVKKVDNNLKNNGNNELRVFFMGNVDKNIIRNSINSGIIESLLNKSIHIFVSNIKSGKMYEKAMKLEKPVLNEDEFLALLYWSN